FEHVRSLFLFQAEDGIRDYKVTGVQTCALPICPGGWESPRSIAATPSRPDRRRDAPAPGHRRAAALRRGARGASAARPRGGGAAQSERGRGARAVRRTAFGG